MEVMAEIASHSSVLVSPLYFCVEVLKVSIISDPRAYYIDQTSFLFFIFVF